MTKLRNRTHVMRDKEHGHTKLFIQLFDQMQDLFLDCYIQGSRRLICDQKLRLAGKCHCDHHSLLHTTG